MPFFLSDINQFHNIISTNNLHYYVWVVLYGFCYLCLSYFKINKNYKKSSNGRWGNSWAYRNMRSQFESSFTSKDIVRAKYPNGWVGWLNDKMSDDDDGRLTRFTTMDGRYMYILLKD